MRDLDSIIFDLDGTLWDSTKEILITWNSVIEKYEGLQTLTRDDLKKFMGTPTSKIFDGLFPNLDINTRKELEEECSKDEMDYLRVHGGKLYEGIKGVLEQLAGKYKLFIVSNCQHGYIETFMNYYGFQKYFSDFEYIGRTGLPKGENIKLVMERNSLESSIYVGDTQGDRKAANLAGIPFIFAKYGFGDVDGYDYVIDNFVELLELV